MTERYVTFSPYYAGLGNVLMSYELALSIAHITGRTLVLPPKAFMAFLSAENHRDKFIDMWDVLYKPAVAEAFSVIDFDNVPELRAAKEKMQTERSYTGNILEHVPNLFWYKPREGNVVCEEHALLVNGRPDTEDCKVFAAGRIPVDLDRPEKFLHFENNLFGHYFYHVYCDKEQRNILKDKMASAMRYKEMYFYMAKEVAKKLGSYNAAHVRRGDFFHQYSEFLKGIDTGDKLLDQVKKFEEYNGLPLYIATDETNRDLFDAFKGQYELAFYDDFGFDLTPLEKAIVEQIICSNANFFMGTKPSTYSAKINKIRGEAGKQSDDYMGINTVLYTEGGWKEMPKDRPAYIDSPIPWTLRADKRWSWDNSTHPHWTKE